MSDLKYQDNWFNYVLKEDPVQIKQHIKEDWITSKGIKIHLDIYDKDENSEQNKTIIFVHGTSVYSRFYAEFCYLLNQNGFRVIAPDLTGHGLSAGIRGHFTMEKFTQNIYDVTTYVIDKYNEDVILIGSSLGGITSLYCAANDSRLKGVICHNAALFNEKAYKKITKLNIFLRFLRALIPLFVKFFPKLKLNVLIYLDFKKLAQSKEVLEMVDFLLEDQLISHKYTLTSLNTQLNAEPAKPIESIKTPIMIINGDEDILFSVDYMEEIFGRLTCKGKELKFLDGASHLIFQENIDEVLNSILHWIHSSIK